MNVKIRDKEYDYFRRIQPDTQILLWRIKYYWRFTGRKLSRGTIKTKTTIPSSGIYGSKACTSGHERPWDRFGIVHEINNREADNIEISNCIK